MLWSWGIWKYTLQVNLKCIWKNLRKLFMVFTYPTCILDTSVVKLGHVLKKKYIYSSVEKVFLSLVLVNPWAMCLSILVCQNAFKEDYEDRISIKWLSGVKKALDIAFGCRCWTLKPNVKWGEKGLKRSIYFKGRANVCENQCWWRTYLCQHTYNTYSHMILGPWKWFVKVLFIHMPAPGFTYSSCLE